MRHVRLIWSLANMSILIEGTTNAKYLNALLVAFIEFKISNVTFRAATGSLGEVKNTSVHSPNANTQRPDLQERTITYDTDAYGMIESNSINSTRAIVFKYVFFDWTERNVFRPFLDTPEMLLPSLVDNSDMDLMPKTLPIRRVDDSKTWNSRRPCNTCEIKRTDKCTQKRPVHTSAHHCWRCPFSELTWLLSFPGVEQRKLRIKDWQNAYGKVGRSR